MGKGYRGFFKKSDKNVSTGIACLERDFFRFRGEIDTFAPRTIKKGWVFLVYFFFFFHLSLGPPTAGCGRPGPVKLTVGMLLSKSKSIACRYIDGIGVEMCDSFHFFVFCCVNAVTRYCLHSWNMTLPSILGSSLQVESTAWATLTLRASVLRAGMTFCIPRTIFF